MIAGCLKLIRYIFRKPLVLALLVMVLSSFGLVKLLQIGYEKAVFIDKFKSMEDSKNEEMIRNALAAQADQVLAVQSSYPHITIKGKGSRCPVFGISPFSDHIMAFMTSFGTLTCKSKENIELHGGSDGLKLTGKNINYIRYREILGKAGDDDRFQLGEFKWILKPKLYETELKRGQQGFIQHALSKRCIRINAGNVMEYGNSCSGSDAAFKFEENGLIRHIASGKCLEPQHSNKEHPPNDTPLTLGTDCKSHFQGALEGLIQHVESKLCVHPLGGGTHPQPGQKLCLWNGCVREERLKYRWFVVPKEIKQSITQTISIQEELAEVETQFADESTQSDFVVNIKEEERAKSKSKKSSGPDNVILLALDQASAAHIERKLPKTFAYLKDEMKVQIFEKHAGRSIGDAGENFLALLQGKPDAAKGIIAEYNDRGYVTLLNIDMPSLLGLEFPDLKADHSNQPLGFYANRKYKTGSNPYCLGSQPIHVLSLAYLEKFLASYSGKAKLAVTLLSEVTHWNANALGYLDDRLLQSLKTIHKLPSTVLFVTSLRGVREGKLGQSLQGKVESRLPFLAMYTSSDISKTIDIKTVEANRDVLTVPSDVYATLLTLGADGQSPVAGASLTSKLTERNCRDLGVPKMTCPCLTLS